jgi:multidrug efflux pump subunit AcrA (membrane-fusion protein)
MSDIIITPTRGQLWRNRLGKPFRFIGSRVDRRPFLSFIVLLILLTAAIVAGNYLRKPVEDTTQKETTPKEVTLYTFDENPSIVVSAQVDKSGVTKIVAQSGGIISDILVKEGSKVGKGQTLLRLSSNYSGGNASSIQRQIAETNYQNAVDTYDKQKDVIAKQRDIAEKGNTQASELREITRMSADDTRALVNENQSTLDNLNNQITQLTAKNTDGSNDAAIAQATQSRNTLEGALAQLKAGLRTADYQGNNEKAPAEIANTQKELTLRQLELQEKGLDVSKNIANLNLKLAQISESAMAPASPFSGVVERIYVIKGQNVAPGTVLLQVTGTVKSATAVALVSKDIAHQVSKLDASKMTYGSDTKEVTPTYVSTEATDGSLYSVSYIVPTDLLSKLTDNDSVSIRIPLVTNENNLYVPIDALYQSGNTSYLFVATEKDGKLVATEKEIKLGSINGSYSEVIDGLSKGDKIIVNRNVVSGDVIQEK